MNNNIEYNIKANEIGYIGEVIDDLEVGNKIYKKAVKGEIASGIFDMVGALVIFAQMVLLSAVITIHTIERTTESLVMLLVISLILVPFMINMIRTRVKHAKIKKGIEEEIEDIKSDGGLYYDLNLGEHIYDYPRVAEENKFTLELMNTVKERIGEEVKVSLMVTGLMPEVAIPKHLKLVEDYLFEGAEGYFQVAYNKGSLMRIPFKYEVEDNGYLVNQYIINN